MMRTTWICYALSAMAGGAACGASTEAQRPQQDALTVAQEPPPTAAPAAPASRPTGGSAASAASAPAAATPPAGAGPARVDIDAIIEKIADSARELLPKALTRAELNFLARQLKRRRESIKFCRDAGIEGTIRDLEAYWAKLDLYHRVALAGHSFHAQAAGTCSPSYMGGNKRACINELSWQLWQKVLRLRRTHAVKIIRSGVPFE
jgi:hypothetical protein